MSYETLLQYLERENYAIIQLRGAITKKKRENLGKIPKGGGVEKNRRKFPISIWEF